MSTEDLLRSLAATAAAASTSEGPGPAAVRSSPRGNCSAAMARLLSAQPHLSPVEVTAALRAMARNSTLHR